MQRIFAAFAVLLTVVALAGCGSSDKASGASDAPAATATTEPAASPATSETTKSADSVEVVAKDIKLDKSSYEASAGDVKITYENEGAIEHTLLIDGVSGFKLDVKAHGDTDSGTVTLKPGTYTLYCGMPGHRAAGMHATLTVS
jgi:plastocyanin